MTASLVTVPQELVGRAELRKLFGVSVARYTQIISRDDFPAPVADLIGGKIWDKADIRRWAKTTGRKLHDDQ